MGEDLLRPPQFSLSIATWAWGFVMGKSGSRPVVLAAVFLAAGMLVPTAAFAQNVNEMLNMFRGAIQQGMRQAASSEWRKVPPTEIACIDQDLRQQGASVEILVNRGILPSDPRLSQLRSNCQSQGSQGVQQAATQSSPYVVDGLALGGQVRPNSEAYKKYQCGPSDKFPGFTWCHEEHTTKENGNEILRSHSILHSKDGTAWYVNGYIEPAFFGPNDVQSEINRLSVKFGQQPRLIRMPLREGLPNAVMGVWGAIQLEPLSADELSTLASGGSSAGLSVSFLGDLERSAKAGVPVYRLAGGAGFLWVATFNQNGQGVLRYLTVDASAIATPIVTTNSPPTPPPAANSMAPTVAQRAVLYEEAPNNSQGNAYVGSAIWHTEPISPGPGIAPQLAVRADVTVPERHMTVTWTLRRNTDQALPASHTIEIKFNVPPDFPEGGIADVPGVLVKSSEQAKGIPLSGQSVKEASGSFTIGLSGADADVQRNVQLLKDQPWFDVPIIYANGHRAILALEKGTTGNRAFADAFAAWENSQTVTPPLVTTSPEESASSPRCETLIVAKPYFVAECITEGMTMSHHLDGLSDAKAAAHHERDGLVDCASDSLMRLQQMAEVTSAKILNSGSITELMDFSDALKLECNRAAGEVFKESTSQGK